jgi:hypothetical protein
MSHQDCLKREQGQMVYCHLETDLLNKWVLSPAEYNHDL